MTSQNALQQIFAMWRTEKNKPLVENALASVITKDFKAEISSKIPTQMAKCKVDASAGKGNWATVSWLFILSQKITKTTSDGIDPAYLFCADDSGVYLTLMLGVKVPQDKLGKPRAEERAASIANFSTARLRVCRRNHAHREIDVK